MMKKKKNVHTPTEYPILATDDHRLHFWLTECSLHQVDNALPHRCTAWGKSHNFIWPFFHPLWNFKLNSKLFLHVTKTGTAV